MVVGVLLADSANKNVQAGEHSGSLMARLRVGMGQERKLVTKI